MTQPPIVPGPPPQPIYYPRPPQKKKMGTGLILTIILVPIGLIGVCAFVAVLFFGSVVADQRQAREDVSVTCSQDSFAMRAVVRVVNSTDRTASYHVTVSFESSDGTRLDTGSAYIRNVAPGKAATDEVLGFAPGNASGARCSVTDVTRI